MKKIFTLSTLSLMVLLFGLSSCLRDGTIISDREDYWLSKEQGEVVYSDSYCNYYVVETYYGYNIVRSYGGYKPFESSILYGNFSNPGTKDLYNYTSRLVFTGTITEYWLTYDEALDALDYYCPIYGKGVKRVFKESTLFKKNK
ncbi:MAG: hypothetical protein JST10_03110 [Bacteroidetes bacterium]|nr:hypothetical protein [Bacteroidota bacterium]MBS1631543.1 hypothetical protein [Bacteroidota bacterium]